MKKMALVITAMLIIVALSGTVYAGEIHNLVLSGNIAKVKAFLDKNPQTLNEKDTIMGLYDWTPLHIAAQRGNLEIAQLLIDRGAKINEVTSDGQTPLHLAAMGGYTKVADLLINWGALISIKDKCDKTPLDWADSQEMIDLLRKNGAHYCH